MTHHRRRGRANNATTWARRRVDAYASRVRRHIMIGRRTSTRTNGKFAWPDCTPEHDRWRGIIQPRAWNWVGGARVEIFAKTHRSVMATPTRINKIYDHVRNRYTYISLWSPSENKISFNYGRELYRVISESCTVIFFPSEMWKIEKLRKNSTFNHIFRQEKIAPSWENYSQAKTARASIFPYIFFQSAQNALWQVFLSASLRALKANTRRLYNAVLMRHTWRRVRIDALLLCDDT